MIQIGCVNQTCQFCNALKTSSMCCASGKVHLQLLEPLLRIRDGQLEADSNSKVLLIQTSVVLFKISTRSFKTFPQHQGKFFE